MLDSANPIVKLCAQGMAEEGAGNFDAARRLFAEAWDTASDDFESCIAAHYVARHQPTDEKTLRWNEIALDHARASDATDVDDFYPSLYLNLGHSHETLGHMDRARHFYLLASQHLNSLPPGSYTEMVKGGVVNALQRIGEIADD